MYISRRVPTHGCTRQYIANLWAADMATSVWNLAVQRITVMEGRHCEMDKASYTKSPPNLASTRKKEATDLGGELVGEGGGRCAEVRGGEAAEVLW